LKPGYNSPFMLSLIFLTVNKIYITNFKLKKIKSKTNPIKGGGAKSYKKFTVINLLGIPHLLRWG